MSHQRQQGEPNHVEWLLHLRGFSTFRIRSMGNTLCGSVIVIAICNAHTLDDATDSLSLKFLLWYI